MHVCVQLIAIMGDSYDCIKEQEMAEGLVQKAEVLYEMDEVFGWLLLKRLDNPNSCLRRLQRRWRLLKKRAGLGLRRLKCWSGRRKQAEPGAGGGGTEEDEEKEEAVQQLLHQEDGEKAEAEEEEEVKFYPKYLKVVQPRDTASGDSDDQWQGKIKALEKSFEKQLKEELKQQEKSFETQLKQQENSLKGEMKEAYQKQDQQLRQILALLEAKQ